MKIEIKEEGKDFIKIEFSDIDSAMPLLLSKYLNQNKKVKCVTIAKEHLEIGKPQLIVKGDNPKKSIQEALQQMMEDLSKLKESIK
mgnify:FL=1